MQVFFFYHGRRGNTERRLEEKIKHRAKTLRRKVFLSGSHKATETQRFFQKLCGLEPWRDSFLAAATAAGSHERNRTKTREQTERRRLRNRRNRNQTNIKRGN